MLRGVVCKEPPIALDLAGCPDEELTDSLRELAAGEGEPAIPEGGDRSSLLPAVAGAIALAHPSLRESGGKWPVAAMPPLVADAHPLRRRQA